MCIRDSYYTIHNYFLHTLVHGKHLLTEIIKHSISFCLSDQLLRWKVGQTVLNNGIVLLAKGTQLEGDVTV